MASEILGLFGKTPAQIRQEQFDSLMVSPAQMGSQGLLQQVASMGGNAGAAVGNLAGRMMGGMAPGEREAMVMQDVMQRVGQDPNMTQAERLRKMAEIVSQQPGMGDQALRLQAAANQLEIQQMKIDEARFKQANRFEDRKETRMVPDGYGGFVPKQFYWTEKYNEETGKWEKMTAPSETPPPTTGEDESALDAEAKRREAAKAGKTQGGATTTPVAEQAIPTPRILPPQNTQLTEAQRLEQLYYDQQQAANPRPAPAPAPARPALPPLTFKTVEDQESAMRRAVAAGNRELAMRIRDAQVGTNR